MRGACYRGSRVDDQLGLALLTRAAVILLLIVEGRPIVRQRQRQRQRLRLGWLRLCWLLVLRHDTTLRLLTRVACHVRTRTAALGRVDTARPAQRGPPLSGACRGLRVVGRRRRCLRHSSLRACVPSDARSGPPKWRASCWRRLAAISGSRGRRGTVAVLGMVMRLRQGCLRVSDRDAPATGVHHRGWATEEPTALCGRPGPWCRGKRCSGQRCRVA